LRIIAEFCLWKYHAIFHRASSYEKGSRVM
jgi:hypothetical protein